LADHVELPASSDESVEPVSLSKENEVEELDPQQPEIQLGDFDEEEYTSEQNESNNEDVNVELDICPASEDEMENVGGEGVVGGDLLPFLHLHHRQEDLRPFTSTTGNRTHDLCTSTTDGLCICITDGEGIYTSSIRARGIIDLQSIQMSYMLDLHGQPLQEQISNIFCIMFEEMQKEAQLKRPPQFQGIFDQTHKKKGTDDYISQKAREVAESYSRGMDEMYGDDSQHPELDPDI
ncbi:hypothetical protein Taro_042044, partial [Colocasia esculenta]|nr:hypothetical protein [Colocasia esculenta]